MIIFRKASTPPGAPKPAKRSVLGMLFNPHLGRTTKPLGESTQILLQLIAMVFSLYGLLPNDYPGVRDTSVRMSLSGVMGTAWRNLRFTREGLPHVIFFFAVTGIMLFSAFAAISALLSIFIGHAHAQDCNGGSCFTLADPSTDVAQGFINYLFGLNGGALATYPTIDPPQTVVPGNTLSALQVAFVSVLAFYSDAILIIAAMILFYHLTAMVAETAHHGQVMGKRANQIWAPIRLVVAIGLLIPISAGLNSGQYIVIKMAEVGSALATNAWSTFLHALTSYNPTGIAPMAPTVTQVATDVMTIDACVYDYNLRINHSFPNGVSTGLTIDPAGTQITTTISGHPGTKYSFSPNNLADQDVCGWYFIPTYTGTDQASKNAFAMEASAFTGAQSALLTAATTGASGASGIASMIPKNMGGTAYSNGIQLDPSLVNAAADYQVALGSNMATVTSTTQAAVSQLEPYGWVFAGALLNMVARVQAMISNAATAGMPETHPPSIVDPDGDWSGGTGKNPYPNSPAAANAAAGWNIRKAVMEDMNNFDTLVSKTWAQTASSSNPQCAAMIGLQDSSQQGEDNKWGSQIINRIFSVVDRAATMSGVWTSGKGQPCGGTVPNTFQIGIQQIGTTGDPLAELAALGHKNLDTAFDLLAISLGSQIAGGVAGGLLSHIKSGVGAAAQGLGAAASGILSFIALIFLICGFTLAYILPMFPYARFFFATLVWVAAMLEAVVAVPLIALAHLNPEGDGLPGASAKNAYFYVFNILLRPILMIFGLVCGLLLFLIAVSLLTYTFNLAVASSGGTAYGHEMLSKIIYTVMYVVMMYVCANHCFSLIDHIPEKALSWMGAQAQAMAHVGDESKIAGTEMMGGSIMSQQMMQTINQSGAHASDMFAKVIGKDPNKLPKDGDPKLAGNITGGTARGGTNHNPTTGGGTPHPPR